MTDAISRSAVLDRLEMFRRHYGLKAGYYDAMTDAIGEVRYAPALDVEPVAHARWVNGKCSRCKTAVLAFSHKENDGFGAIAVGNGGYCSNCGARMDGEAE